MSQVVEVVSLAMLLASGASQLDSPAASMPISPNVLAKAARTDVSARGPDRAMVFAQWFNGWRNGSQGCFGPNWRNC
jgi:hypothetical protein